MPPSAGGATGGVMDAATAARRRAEAAFERLAVAVRRRAPSEELKALSRQVASAENDERAAEGEPVQNVERRAAVVLGQAQKEINGGARAAVVENVVVPVAKAARRFARV